MNKVAVLAGVSATLAVLVIDASVKNYTLLKKNQKLTRALRYNELRFKLATEEVNFGYQNLDQWKREELAEIFHNNEKYLKTIAKAL